MYGVWFKAWGSASASGVHGVARLTPSGFRVWGLWYRVDGVRFRGWDRGLGCRGAWTGEGGTRAKPRESARNGRYPAVAYNLALPQSARRLRATRHGRQCEARPCPPNADQARQARRGLGDLQPPRELARTPTSACVDLLFSR